MSDGADKNKKNQTHRKNANLRRQNNAYTHIHEYIFIYCISCIFSDIHKHMRYT